LARTAERADVLRTEAKCLCMFVVGAVAVAIAFAIASAVTRCLGGRWKMEDDCGERREIQRAKERRKCEKEKERHETCLGFGSLGSVLFILHSLLVAGVGSVTAARSTR
jgi:hypothetical protein